MFLVQTICCELLADIFNLAPSPARKAAAEPVQEVGRVDIFGLGAPQSTGSRRVGDVSLLTLAGVENFLLPLPANETACFL